MYRLNWLLLLTFFSVRGQEKFGTNYFNKTNWASLNHDSCFFINDTVKLVKIESKAINKPENFEENLSEYFNKNNYVILHFKNGNNLEFQYLDINSWTTTKLRGSYKWYYDSKNQIVSLFFKNKLLSSFVLIGENKTQVKSIYSGRPPKPTIELILKRKSSK